MQIQGSKHIPCISSSITNVSTFVNRNMLNIYGSINSPKCGSHRCYHFDCRFAMAVKYPKSSTSRTEVKSDSGEKTGSGINRVTLLPSYLLINLTGQRNTVESTVQWQILNYIHLFKHSTIIDRHNFSIAQYPLLSISIHIRIYLLKRGHVGIFPIHLPASTKKNIFFSLLV